MILGDTENAVSVLVFKRKVWYPYDEVCLVLTDPNYFVMHSLNEHIFAGTTSLIQKKGCDGKPGALRLQM